MSLLCQKEKALIAREAIKDLCDDFMSTAMDHKKSRDWEVTDFIEYFINFCIKNGQAFSDPLLRASEKYHIPEEFKEYMVSLAEEVVRVNKDGTNTVVTKEELLQTLKDNPGKVMPNFLFMNRSEVDELKRTSKKDS